VRTFFSTTSVHNGEKVESCTIADSLGNSVFITEADWIEIGRMKGWTAPIIDTTQVLEEIPCQ
jgi:hypothetical protein